MIFFMFRPVSSTSRQSFDGLSSKYQVEPRTFQWVWKTCYLLKTTQMIIIFSFLKVLVWIMCDKCFCCQALKSDNPSKSLYSACVIENAARNNPLALTTSCKREMKWCAPPQPNWEAMNDSEETRSHLTKILWNFDWTE